MVWKITAPTGHKFLFADEETGHVFVTDDDGLRNTALSLLKNAEDPRGKEILEELKTGEPDDWVEFLEESGHEVKEWVWPHTEAAFNEAAALFSKGMTESLLLIATGKWKVEDSQVARVFPPRYAHHYADPGFQMNVLVATIAMVAKITEESIAFRPRSTAEEMMLWEILDIAGDLAAESETGMGEEDFDSLEEMYADLDFRFLFEGQFDGIEDSPIAGQMGMANMRFDEWFAPFRPESRPIHYSLHIVADEADIA